MQNYLGEFSDLIKEISYMEDINLEEVNYLQDYTLGIQNKYKPSYINLYQAFRYFFMCANDFGELNFIFLRDSQVIFENVYESYMGIYFDFKMDFLSKKDYKELATKFEYFKNSNISKYKDICLNYNFDSISIYINTIHYFSNSYEECSLKALTYIARSPYSSASNNFYKKSYVENIGKYTVYNSENIYSLLLNFEILNLKYRVIDCSNNEKTDVLSVLDNQIHGNTLYFNNINYMNDCYIVFINNEDNLQDKIKNKAGIHNKEATERKLAFFGNDNLLSPNSENKFLKEYIYLLKYKNKIENLNHDDLIKRQNEIFKENTLKIEKLLSDRESVLKEIEFLKDKLKIIDNQLGGNSDN